MSSGQLAKLVSIQKDLRKCYQSGNCSFLLVRALTLEYLTYKYHWEENDLSDYLKYNTNALELVDKDRIISDQESLKCGIEICNYLIDCHARGII